MLSYTILSANLLEVDSTFNEWRALIILKPEHIVSKFAVRVLLAILDPSLLLLIVDASVCMLKGLVLWPRHMQDCMLVFALAQSLLVSEFHWRVFLLLLLHELWIFHLQQLVGMGAVHSLFVHVLAFWTRHGDLFVLLCTVFGQRR